MKKKHQKFNPNYSQKQTGKLSFDDQEIWKKVADTITPLQPDAEFAVQFEAFHKSVSGGLQNSDPTQSSSSIALNASNTGTRTRKPAAATPQIQQIDVKTARKIAKGKMAIDRRLDLHGMTQAQAHFALENFLYAAQGTGARTVLVITGKGNLGQGVLRLNVPRWLREPPLNKWVVSFSSSASHHGGEGALYVRLKKPSVSKDGI